MRIAARALSPLVLVAALAFACGDDDAPLVSPLPDGSSGASSGTNPSNVDGGRASAGSVGSIAIDDIVEISVSSDICFKPAGLCLDAQSFTVDFVASRLTHATCVELGAAPDGGPGETQNVTRTTTLSPEQLGSIKRRLASLVTGSRSGVDGGFAGPSQTLLVVTRVQGEVSFATVDTVCAPSPRTVGIQSGWTELYDALRAM